MKDKTEAILAILKDRPVIYGVDFEKAHLKAVKNHQLRIVKSHNIEIDVARYKHGIENGETKYYCTKP